MQASPPERLLAPIVWISLGLMLFLTFVDVMGRYVFGAPVRGALEVTEILMGLLIFAGLPIVTLRREHIVLGLIDTWLQRRPSLWRSRTVLVDMIAAAGESALAWFTGFQALDMYRYGNALPLLQWPTAPFVAFMSLMSAAAAAISIWQLVRTLKGQ